MEDIDSFPAILSFASSESKYDGLQHVYDTLRCTRSEEELQHIRDMRRYDDYKWKLIMLLGSYSGKDSPTGNYILEHTPEEIEGLEGLEEIDRGVKMTYLDCFDVPRIEPEPKRLGISPFNRLCSESYTGYEKEIHHSSNPPTPPNRIKPCCEEYDNPDWFERFSNYAWKARYVIIFLTSGWIDSPWTFLELLLYKELIKNQPAKNFIIVTGLDYLEGDYIRMIFDFMTINKKLLDFKLSVIDLEKNNLINDYENILKHITDRSPLTTDEIPKDLIRTLLQNFEERRRKMMEITGTDFISLRAYKCMNYELKGGYKKSKRKTKRKKTMRKKTKRKKKKNTKKR